MSDHAIRDDDAIRNDSGDNLPERERSTPAVASGGDIAPDHGGRKPRRGFPGKRPGGKYRNKAVVIDGIRFASKKEGKRYEVLRDMQARGEIIGLKCHTSWKIVVRDILICRYIDDFNYTIAGAGGSFVVEDVKGWKTDVYKLKRKMMLAVHGIEILET